MKESKISLFMLRQNGERRNDLKKESGLLSLEASIVVTIFIFLMLFLYSFFIVFEARNEMAHTILATTHSLSLDPYANTKIGLSDKDKIDGFFKTLYSYTIKKSDFTTEKDWSTLSNSQIAQAREDTVNELKEQLEQVKEDSSLSELERAEKINELSNQINLEQINDDVKITSNSSAIGDLIKQRFIAYLADGDIELANKILDRYHIVGGVDGLDFSKSYVQSHKIHVILEYKIEYEFKVFQLGTLKMRQSACSRLWDE